MKFSISLMPMCALLGLAVSPTAALADYQSEISYYSQYRQYDGSVDRSLGVLDYRYYFEKVTDDDSQPWAEDAYLQRVSNIEVGLIGEIYKYPSGNELTGGGLGFAYTYMQKGSPLILSVLYDSVSLDYNYASGGTAYTADDTQTGLSAGWFLDATTSVNVNYETEKFDYSPASYSVYNEKSTSLYFSGKTIKSLGGDTAINLEAKLGQIEYATSSTSKTNTQLGVAGDYYLNHKMSVGGSYVTESGDAADYEGTTTGIRGRFFFTRQFVLSLGLASFSASNTSGTSYDDTDLELLYRF